MGQSDPRAEALDREVALRPSQAMRSRARRTSQSTALHAVEIARPAASDHHTPIQPAR